MFIVYYRNTKIIFTDKRESKEYFYNIAARTSGDTQFKNLTILDAIINTRSKEFVNVEAERGIDFIRYVYDPAIDDLVLCQ